jgi:hypothetical protein
VTWAIRRTDGAERPCPLNPLLFRAADAPPARYPSCGVLADPELAVRHMKRYLSVACGIDA